MEGEGGRERQGARGSGRRGVTCMGRGFGKEGSDICGWLNIKNTHLIPPEVHKSNVRVY